MDNDSVERLTRQHITGCAGGGGGHSRDDKVTFRVNKAGLVCLLYHIKPFEGSSTSGVECVILPLTPEQDSLDLPDG